MIILVVKPRSRKDRSWIVVVSVVDSSEFCSIYFSTSRACVGKTE